METEDDGLIHIEAARSWWHNTSVSWCGKSWYKPEKASWFFYSATCPNCIDIEHQSKHGIDYDDD